MAFLLNVCEYDLDLCMFELIRMLVHNIFQDNRIYNFFEKRGKIDETEIEAFTYLITKKIAQSLYSKEKVAELLKKAEEGGFRKYILDRFSQLESKFDIERNSVFRILKQNY